jgi:hypothetical protein
VHKAHKDTSNEPYQNVVLNYGCAFTLLQRDNFLRRLVIFPEADGHLKVLFPRSFPARCPHI